MKFTVLPSVSLAFCLAIATPAVRAGQANQKTIFTFNEPVELPEHVLEPGTYVFKVLNNLGDRDVVQIYGKNEQHLYGTFLTVLDYRLKTPSKPIITFSERPAGSPEAVRAWFYPGDNYGHEFVYPRSRATQLAKANNEPVASMADQEYNSSSMKQGHIKAMQSTGVEVDVIEVFGNNSRNTKH